MHNKVTIVLGAGYLALDEVPELAPVYDTIVRARYLLSD